MPLPGLHAKKDATRTITQAWLRAVRSPSEIERVDRLVRSIAAQKGMHCAPLDEVVAVVEERLQANRQAS